MERSRCGIVARDLVLHATLRQATWAYNFGLCLEHFAFGRSGIANSCAEHVTSSNVATQNAHRPDLTRRHN